MSNVREARTGLWYILRNMQEKYTTVSGNVKDMPSLESTSVDQDTPKAE